MLFVAVRREPLQTMQNRYNFWYSYLGLYQMLDQPLRKPLTHSRQAEAAKPEDKTYTLNAGDGLFLEVIPNGSRRWRYRYSHGGKRKLLSMGVFPAIGLQDAKLLRDKANALVAQGIDPSEVRQDGKAAAKLSSENTFKSVADEWLDRQTQYAESTRGKAVWLLSFAIDEFGHKAIEKITPPMVLAACRKAEIKGNLETAKGIKIKCSQVFCYAVGTGLVQRDPTTDLRRALKPPQTKHRAAITDIKLIPEFLRDIHGSSGDLNTRCALKLAPLVFIRPGELRGALWADIDFEAAEWLYTPPKTRNQTQVELVVPLARQTIEILRELYELNGHTPYVFFSSQALKHKIMSENTVNLALRRLGYTSEEMCGHGFRALAMTTLKERLKIPEEYIELQLGHRKKNIHGSAYDRTSFLDERKAMMQTWADYIDFLRTGQSVAQPTTDPC